jgi:hypothetical protein
MRGGATLKHSEVLGVNLADIPASDVPPGPLSLCILSADIDGMLASLVLLER